MAAVLIAGPTGGIGSITLQHLDKLGHFRGSTISLLILVDFYGQPGSDGSRSKQAKLISSLKTLGGVATCLHWDASSVSSTSSLVQAIDSLLVPKSIPLLATLITTGIGFHGDPKEISIEQSAASFDKLMKINVMGPSLLAQHCAKRMPDPAAPGSIRMVGAPTIVLMSSYSGLFGLSQRASYCASKFALNGFAESIFADFPHIRMVMVCPTTVSTNFRDNWKSQMASSGTKEKMNKAEMTPEECGKIVFDAWGAAAKKTTRSVERDVHYVVVTRRVRAHLAYMLARIPYISPFLEVRRKAAREAKL